jgi:endonuclease/exonuclease/phosphatase family metal-dependent hydrolase
MKLLTWNVYFGGHMFEERRDALVAELARMRPDVIALQEVTAEHVEALAELPGYASTFELSLDEATRRIEQFDLIHRRLASKDRVVLCGDFNLRPDDVEQAAIDRADPAWTDAWLALRFAEPGYTVDTDVNTMRYQLKEKRTQKRIDRVLLRGVTARSIELVGTSPVDVDGTFVSDHFGLLANLDV